MNAVCLLGIVPVRAKPGDREEMVTQLLYGETVEILEQHGGWRLVRGHADGYEGWVDRLQIEPLADIRPPRSIVSAPLLKNAGKWLPMGSLLRPGDDALDSLESSGTRPWGQPGGHGLILDLVKQFLHAPYLWGGRSVLGVDCSGLTQTVYRTAGHALPRDSPDQALQGRESSLEACRPADLAFFKKPGAPDRITHVGLVIPQSKGWRIIHASGRVREDKLDGRGIWNEAGTLTHELLTVRQLIP